MSSVLYYSALRGLKPQNQQLNVAKSSSAKKPAQPENITDSSTEKSSADILPPVESQVSDHAAPVSEPESIPVESTPVESIPIESIPHVESTSVESVPVESIPQPISPVESISPPQTESTHVPSESIESNHVEPTPVESESTPLEPIQSVPPPQEVASHSPQSESTPSSDPPTSSESQPILSPPSHPLPAQQPVVASPESSAAPESPSPLASSEQSPSAIDTSPTPVHNNSAAPKDDHHAAAADAPSEPSLVSDASQPAPEPVDTIRIYPWDDDSVRQDCSNCAQPFTVVNRRHHCRSCGHLFCSNCSSIAAPIPKFGYQTPVRVCIPCSQTLQSEGVASVPISSCLIL